MGGVRPEPCLARASYSGVVTQPRPRGGGRVPPEPDDSDDEDPAGGLEDAGEVGELQDLGSFSFTLDPTTSRFRQAWDIMTALLIIYIAFVLPVTMSFEPQVSASMLAWDIAIDVVFMIDLPLNFVTGYPEDGVVVREQRKVALHYLRG